MKNIKIDIKADELRKKLNIKDGKDGRDGKDGKDGAPGKDGKDGISINASEVALEASKLAQVELEKSIKHIDPKKVLKELEDNITPKFKEEIDNLKKGFSTFKPTGGNTEVFEDGVKRGSGQALNFGKNIDVTHDGHTAQIKTSDSPEFDTVNFNTSYTPTGTEPVGSTYWDSDNHTLSTVLENGAILQHGFELYTFGTDEGNNFPEGSAVSVKGSTGNKVAFELTDLSDIDSVNNYIGLITTPVDSGNRIATREGAVRGINTTGIPQGETWAEGDWIYVSSTPGGLTNVEPTSGRIIRVGTITNVHQNQGVIELDRLILPTLTEILETGSTFESYNKNLLSYPYTITETSPTVTTIDYTSPSGTITKTITEVSSSVTTIAIGGIGTKTITETSPTLVTIAYS